jgi:hypothetical protein
MWAIKWGPPMCLWEYKMTRFEKEKENRKNKPQEHCPPIELVKLLCPDKFLYQFHP